MVKRIKMSWTSVASVAANRASWKTALDSRLEADAWKSRIQKGFHLRSADPHGISVPQPRCSGVKFCAVSIRGTPGVPNPRCICISLAPPLLGR